MARCAQADPVAQLAAANLTPKQIEVLALWCFDGCSERDIAGMLGISNIAVHKLLVRGREKLEAQGMKMERLPDPEKPKIYPMDPRRIDQLGPKDYRGVC